jgi:hypothetical protein
MVRPDGIMHRETEPLRHRARGLLMGQENPYRSGEASGVGAPARGWLPCVAIIALVGDDWAMGVWILAIAGAVYYVGSPILVLLTNRQSARPDPQPVDLEAGAIPHESAEFMLGVLDSLGQIGFEPVGVLDILRQADNTAMFVMMVINDKSRDHALAVTIFGLNGSQMRLSKFFTQFVSRYADGLFIQTSNVSVSGAFPQSPNSIITKLPSVTDLDRLYQIHQMIVDEHRRGEPKILRVVSEFNGDAAAYLRHDIREDLKHAQSCGYLTPIRDASAFRPTIKGAVMMTYKQLLPFKAIGAAARKLRERKVLSAARSRGIAV